MDWQQLIDEAVDGRLESSAFAAPDPAAPIAGGRAALRRRRAVLSTLTCTVVIVLGGAAWAVPSNGTRGAQPGPATQPPSSTSTPSDPVPIGTPTAESALPPPATLDAETGELVVEDGWRVASRIEHPATSELADGSDIVRSTAVDVQRGARHQWMVLYQVSGSDSPDWSWAEPGDLHVTDFARWVDLEVAMSTRTWSTALVGRGASGLAPSEGVTILDQALAPELGPTIRVAEIEIAGLPRWVVARPVTGGFEARVFEFTPGAEPSQFVEHVRSQGLLENDR